MKKRRRISVKPLWICLLIPISLFLLLFWVGLIYFIAVEKMFLAGLIFSAIALSFLFLFCLGANATLKIIEFYPDKLVFKTLYGKVFESVSIEDVISVHIEEEDMTYRGFLLRYYIFDIVGDEKYLKKIPWFYNQSNYKHIATPFRMDCSAESERILKEFLQIPIPNSTSSCSPKKHL